MICWHMSCHDTIHVSVQASLIIQGYAWVGKKIAPSEDGTV